MEQVNKLYVLDQYHMKIRMSLPQGEANNSDIFRVFLSGDQFPETKLRQTTEGVVLEITGGLEFWSVARAFAELCNQQGLVPEGPEAA
jgi:hypothetical protein